MSRPPELGDNACLQQPLPCDTSFDFDKVMNLVPSELRDGLEKEVRDHGVDFVQQFTHMSECSDEDVDVVGDGEGNASSALSA